MLIARLLGAAAIGLMVVAGSANAATYKATSNHNDGTFDDTNNTHDNPNHATHSVWFSNDGNPQPPNATGNAPNHFLFEFAPAGHGILEVNGNTATLTGEVRNEDDQGFDLVMHLVKLADTSMVGIKNAAGASPTDVGNWTFWALSTEDDKKSTLKDSTGSGLGDYEISLRGQKDGKDLFVQLGIGANDKDANKFGLSSWTKFTRTDNCGGAHQPACAHYDGDVNIVLEVVPLPAGLILLPTGLVVLGAMRRRRKA